MPEVTVTAVVLRRFDVGESDRRLTLFSRELGKIDVVAKGARKSGSRLAGASEPLMVAQFQLAVGRVRRFVTQAQPMSSLAAVRSDYDRLLSGLAVLELLNVHLPYEAEHAQAFDAVLSALASLGGSSGPEAALVWFASKFLAIEGHLPDWTLSAVSQRPLDGAEAWVSATAGGSVTQHEAERFGDRRPVALAVLSELSAVSELDRPPAVLEHPRECSVVLLRFWQGLLDSPLPAWESAVQAGREVGE